MQIWDEHLRPKALDVFHLKNITPIEIVAMLGTLLRNERHRRNRRGWGSVNLDVL